MSVELIYIQFVTKLKCPMMQDGQDAKCPMMQDFCPILQGRFVLLPPNFAVGLRNKCKTMKIV